MQRRRCWQQCCIMQPCPDKPQSAEGRLCHFPECSDSMHCCWGATSWGALWVCLYTRVSMGWGLRGSGMLGWVGIQWCVWGCVRDNESHPTQFWKPSFMADLSHLVLCSEKKRKKLKKSKICYLKMWRAISLPWHNRRYIFMKISFCRFISDSLCHFL